MRARRIALFVALVLVCTGLSAQTVSVGPGQQPTIDVINPAEPSRPPVPKSSEQQPQDEAAELERMLSPEELELESSRRAAFERARTLGKLVLVRHAPPAEVDRDQRQAIMEEVQGALSAPAVRRRIKMFETCEAPSRKRYTFRKGEKTLVATTLAVVEPWGRTLVDWENEVPDHAMLAERLDGMIRGGAAFVEGGRGFHDGDEAKGWLSFGTGYLQARMTQEARTALLHARAAAEAKGDAALVQVSQILTASTWTLDGQPRKAIKLLEPITDNPATPENEAAAWAAIGRAREALGDRSGTRQAFAKAAAAAPGGSELKAMTTESLRRSGANASELQRVAAERQGAIRILPPPRAVVSGRTLFQVLIGDPEIDEVHFFLDDQEVSVQRRPPFEARLDLGSLPRSRTIRVVAYRDDGLLSGTDAITVNAKRDDFRVRITSPDVEQISGDVVVEAVVPRVEDQSLRMVEISWNDRLVARFTKPPFRKTLHIGIGESGVLRAVGVLEDGTTAEDLRLLNWDVAFERMDVRVVELYTTVEDRKGRPVAGLTLDDFSIREDGVEQTPQQFLPASTVPLTLGLLLDSSSSMETRMLEVEETAADFLGATVGIGDQAFLIDFDTRPRILQSTTPDLDALASSLIHRQARGTTALYDAIIFGLLQLRGVGGRKALVVLTDGEDNSSRYGPDVAGELARRSGVPVFLLAMRHSFARGFRLDLAEIGMNRIVKDSGGRLFVLKDHTELPGVYAKIHEELANQHLLTYVSHSTRPEEQWRRVEVRTKRGDLVVRTISGYYP